MKKIFRFLFFIALMYAFELSKVYVTSSVTALFPGVHYFIIVVLLAGIFTIVTEYVEERLSPGRQPLEDLVKKFKDFKGRKK